MGPTYGTGETIIGLTKECTELFSRKNPQSHHSQGTMRVRALPRSPLRRSPCCTSGHPRQPAPSHANRNRVGMCGVPEGGEFERRVGLQLARVTLLALLIVGL